MTSDLMAPTIKRIRAYFAPVNRAAHQPTVFDPAQNGGFPLESPPAPWVDLGWIQGFARTSETSVAAVRAGAPASSAVQVRSEIGAKVRFAFESWGKLQLALAAGTQQMNLLAVKSGATAAASGGIAASAMPLVTGSTASILQLDPAQALTLQAGSLLVVDTDYVPGTTGYLGSGVSGAYVRTGLTDVDYVRRVSLNVARVSSVNGGAVTLERPLLAGLPTSGMKVSSVVGFCDREGSTFFQEWSALFVGEGQQGERVIWHYPRLQTASGIEEEAAKSAGGYEALRLAGSFRALPISDVTDGEKVVCFRSYVHRS